MVWLQVVSNTLVGAAYVTISSTLYYIVRHMAPFTELQATHEKAKHMEQFIASEVAEQTSELTRELVSLRAERDELKRALGG